MKITKQKLKQIIKEELSRVLLEGYKMEPGFEEMEETARFLENEYEGAEIKVEYLDPDGYAYMLFLPGEEDYQIIWDDYDLEDALAKWDSNRPPDGGGEGLAGETHEKTLADYKEHPEWFN
tara:strand:+ start:178 stop:540 length:363 start_codon:yes stop_codon:yes gene_type:complete